MNCNVRIIIKIRTNIYAHNQAMLLFHQYMLVGGMPMPVVAFIESKKDFTEPDKEKRDILKLYREDIMKIDMRYRSKVLAIYDQIPGFLSQHEKELYSKATRW